MHFYYTHESEKNVLVATSSDIFGGGLECGTDWIVCECKAVFMVIYTEKVLA